jgi:hypothetical protein
MIYLAKSVHVLVRNELLWIDILQIPLETLAFELLSNRATILDITELFTLWHKTVLIKPQYF